MSRVLGTAALVLLGGSSISGGVYLANRSKGVDAELPELMTDFQKKGHEQVCVNGLFSGLEQLETTPATAATSADSATDFFDTGKKTTGCLVVNWDKDIKEENNTAKWRGTFRLMWAVKGEKTQGTTGQEKGFIVFLVGKTPASGDTKEIQWDGTIYTLTRSGDESSGRKWTTAKSSITPSTPAKAFRKETSGSTTDKNKFPQSGTALKAADNKAAIGDFWGWFAGANDLDHIVTSNDATKNKSLRAYWSWSGSEGVSGSGDTHKLADWTSCIDSWWTEVFDTNAFKVKDASNERTGTWTQLKFLENERPKIAQSE